MLRALTSCSARRARPPRCQSTSLSRRVSTRRVAMPTHDHTKAYKNVTPFQPNRGKKIPDKAKTALEQAVSASCAGCCSRCADQVVWKKKYGKFKALGQPRKWCVLPRSTAKSRSRRRARALLVAEAQLTSACLQQRVRQVHHQGRVPQPVQRRVLCVCPGGERGTLTATAVCVWRRMRTRQGRVSEVPDSTSGAADGQHTERGGGGGQRVGGPGSLHAATAS